MVAGPYLESPRPVRDSVFFGGGNKREGAEGGEGGVNVLKMNKNENLN